MKSKTLLIAVLSVGILAGLAFFDYKSEESETNKKETSSRLFTLKFDQVNEFEINRKDEKGIEDKIVLKRTVSGWELLEPVRDIASNSEVENFLKELIEEKSLDTVKESGSISWSEYQLDKPKAKITVRDQSGKSESLDISEMTNFENRQYARRGQEEKVLTVGGSFKARASETNIRFRERKLFRGKLSEVTRISLNIGSKEVVGLEKVISKGSSDGSMEWRSTTKNGHKIDQNKVRELLTQISETKISNYLVNGKPTEIDKIKSNFLKKTAQLVLQTNEGKWIVDFSLNSQKDLYAITSEPAFLVKIEPGQWEKFENIKMASLVDASEFFAFDQKSVEKVVVKKGKGEVVYTKNGGVWESKSNDEKAKPDPKYVETLFKNLSTVALKEISPQSKLNSTQTKIEFKGPADSTLFSIEEGLLGKDTKALITSKSKNILILDGDLAL